MPTNRTSDSLVTKIRNSFSRVTKAPSSSSIAGGSGLDVAGFLGSQRQNATVQRTTPEFLAAYNVLPWLRAGGQKKAQSIAGTEWLALTEDPETEQLTPINELVGQKHPLEIFLDQPHPLFSWATINFIWSVHLDLIGEAFGIWDRTSEGLQIWPITPDKITALPILPDKPFFTLSLSTGQYEIPYESVFWMVDIDPTAPYSRGSGIVKSLNTELNIDKEAAETIDAFFKNQARPDILITGKGLNPEKTKKMETEWRSKLGGFFNAFKPHFMSEEVDVKEFKQDFASVQFLELRRLQRDTITQVLGIPPEIMGILQNSNRATIEAADLFFSRWTLKPRLDALREAYQRQIVPMFDDTGLIEIDYVSPVAEDREYEAQLLRYAPWAFMIDEVREKAGQEPLPNGRGQSLLLPMALTPTPIDSLPGPASEVGTDTTAPSPNEPQNEPANPNEPESLLPGPAANAPPVSALSFRNWNKGRRVTTGKGRIVKLRR